MSFGTRAARIKQKGENVITVAGHHNDDSLLVVDIKDAADFETAVYIMRHRVPGAQYDKAIKRWTIPVATLEDIPPFYDTTYGKEVVVVESPAVRRFERQFAGRNLAIEVKAAYEFDLELNGRLKTEDEKGRNIAMRPYQTVGAKFFDVAGKALNGDTVGLGKSVQGIAASQMRFERDEADCFLLLIPASLTEKWMGEIEKFTHSPVLRLNRNELLKKNPLSRWKRRYRAGYYLILSYQMTFRYLDRLIKDLEEHPDFSLGAIIDEVQYVKNYGAKRTKASKQILHRCKYVYGLSATYLETSVTNIHSIFEGINPGVFRMSEYKFRDRYAETSYWGQTTGYKHGDEIKKRLEPWVIRRHAEDVSDQMPERVETTYWIDLNAKQAEFYKDVLQQVTDKINDSRREGQLQVATALSLTMYLRQACLNTAIMGHKNPVDSKFDMILELLSETERRDKVVIFCFFAQAVKALGLTLDGAGIKNRVVHAGNCPVKDRLKVIEEFGESDEKVLVTSDILREGHDVVVAPHIINYDILWNPSSMEQRSGRIHRLSQTASTVFVNTVLSKGTVEQYMFERMSAYREMGHDLMDNKRVFRKISVKEIIKALEFKPEGGKTSGSDSGFKLKFGKESKGKSRKEKVRKA
jgi:SNF2 family DNA or RNA helicase